jgi:hypothetical protein
LLPSIIKSKQERKDEEAKRKDEEAKLNQQKELQQLKEEREEKDRQLQKEKKTKLRFRLFSIVLGVMLIGLFFAINQAVRYEAEAKIATAELLIGKQDYEGAISVLSDQSFFSLFNFSYREALEKLRDSAATGSAMQKQYWQNIQAGDAIADSGSALLGLADSLIYLADAFAMTSNLSDFAYSSVNGKKLLEALDGPTLLEARKEARKCYLEAQKTGFRPDPSDSRSAENKLREIDQGIDRSFQQSLNAILVFLHAKDLQKARAAYVKAQYLDSTARSDAIALNENARNVLDSLQQVLKK